MMEIVKRGFYTYFTILLILEVVYSKEYHPIPNAAFVPPGKQGSFGQVFVYDRRHPMTLYPVCSEVFEQDAANVFCDKYTKKNDVTAQILDGDGIKWNLLENIDSKFKIMYSMSVRYLDCIGAETIDECDIEIVDGFCGRSATLSNLFAHVMCLNRNVSQNESDLEVKIQSPSGSEKQNWGQLLVRHLGLTGAFCMENGGLSEAVANVTCHQMGFPGGVPMAVRMPLSNTVDSFSITQGSIVCSGFEMALSECEQPKGVWPFKAGTMTCDLKANDSTAGVLCYAKNPEKQLKLRLQDGASPWSGRLEMYYGDKWRSFCHSNNSPGDEFAEVACQNMGFHTGRGVGGSYFGAGDTSIFMETRSCGDMARSLLTCDGFEKNWEQMNHVCHKRKHIFGVVCHKTVRLKSHNSDSPTSFMLPQGQVQIRRDNKWLPVCSAGWSKDDATVVCRELGYRRSIVISRDYFPSVNAGIQRGMVFSKIDCTGYEYGISQCQFIVGRKCTGPMAFTWCSNDDISAMLVETVQLEGTIRGTIGYVLAVVGNQRGYICPTLWDDRAANAVCRSVGYAGGVTTTVKITHPPRRRFVMSDVECRNNLDVFSDCEYTLNPPRCQQLPASVHCYSNILDVFRFHIYGTAPGMVLGELFMHLKGKNGTLVSTSNTLNKKFQTDLATLVCRNLGWMVGEMWLKPFRRQVSGPAWVLSWDKENCSTADKALLKCTKYIDDGIEMNAYDLIIGCYNKFRVRTEEPSTSGSFGVLQLFDPLNGWLPICSDQRWSEQSASHICAVLGYNSEQYKYEEKSTNISLAVSLSCTGSKCSEVTKKCRSVVYLQCSSDEQFSDDWIQTGENRNISEKHLSSNFVTFLLSLAAFALFDNKIYIY